MVFTKGNHVPFAFHLTMPRGTFFRKFAKPLLIILPHMKLNGTTAKTEIQVTTCVIRKFVVSTSCCPLRINLLRWQKFCA